MNSVSVLHPSFVSAFEDAVGLLRSMAEYQVPHEIQDRMRELGENKEACTPGEREEHRQLAEFWRTQTLHKLQALNVLKRLHEVAPDLVDASWPSEQV